MTEADLDSKFEYLVGLRAGRDKAEELAPVLKGLESVNDIGEVMARLELPAARIEEI